MSSSRGPLSPRRRFDDDHAVANTGLLPATLAERLGIDCWHGMQGVRGQDPSAPERIVLFEVEQG